ncbi:hypothetical protein [Halomonas icarae]|uniref:Uncharacterized protein n=1 Tax=Halomonas icarae TaxID=2691040 RepID=A0A7X5AL03_9GAMM|nr:hypothetical protein [Halomonas icarae]MDR5900978.1 hypothetical protein [Halomonas icarae]NAW11253.1 hypothetical protein [Halomonas icarae]
MTRARPLKALLWLGLTPVVLYGIYLLAANALLASAWGRAQFDRAPRLTVEWQHAWTVVPGRVEVTQLRLSGSAAERDVTLAAERATLNLALVPLLHREIRVHVLEAERVRHASLDAYRLAGKGTLRLAGVHWHAGEIGADSIALALEDGIIRHGDRVLAQAVALNAELRLAPLILAEHPGGEATRFLSGTLALAGRSDAYDVFNPYLAALDWLAIDGSGDLTGNIAIERGEVLPGSRLRLNSPRLSVRLDERHWLEGGSRYRIEGSGAIEAEVAQRARLTLELDQVVMSEAMTDTASQRPVIGGDGFRLTLETPVLRLDAPPDTLQRAELQWRNVEAQDVASFDHYLPAPVPLTLLGGSARLEGKLTYADQRLTGGLDLAGDAISVRLGEQPLRGRLDLHLPIVELDIGEDSVDVSGTRLHLEAAASSEEAPLSALLELPVARFRSPLNWRKLDDVTLSDAGAEFPTRVEVEWRDARFPDVAVLDGYLPSSSPLRLHGGRASSDGRLLFAGERAQGRVTLSGDAIEGRLLQEAFNGELDLTLELRDLHPASQRLDLSGSRLTVKASTNGAEPVQTQLVARQARLQGGLDWPGSDTPARPLSGTLRLDGLLDRLDFINAFLPAEHGVTIQGGGRLSTDLRFADGDIVAGSELRLHSDRLATRFLHYEAFGDGSLILTTTDPGAELHLSMPRFGLRRQGDAGALIEGRLLEIHSQARHLAMSQGLSELNTRIEIPHLVAPDLAAFNDYLPPGSTLELLAGQARLALQLQLEGMRAQGRLELHAPEARLAVHKQTLDGTLHLDTRLTDGHLDTLDFDISGSRLNLDGVRLADAAGNLSRGWWARLTLPEGRLRWETPLVLDARLELAMRDSGLLVNLLVDAARERRWLRKRLTLGEVQGETRVILADNSVRLENLDVRGGESLELLANLALRDSRLVGRAFARYGPLRLGIDIDDGRRRWQLRNARAWYTSGQPASELVLPESETWFDSLRLETD